MNHIRNQIVVLIQASELVNQHRLASRQLNRSHSYLQVDHNHHSLNLAGPEKQRFVQADDQGHNHSCLQVDRIRHSLMDECEKQRFAQAVGRFRNHKSIGFRTRGNQRFQVGQEDRLQHRFHHNHIRWQERLTHIHKAEQQQQELEPHMEQELQLHMEQERHKVPELHMVLGLEPHKVLVLELHNHKSCRRIRRQGFLDVSEVDR
jgi:hypothetical protein